MTTPILGIAEVSQSQSNKEVTINDALRALEGATQDKRDATITGDTTLSGGNFTAYFYHNLSGSPSAFNFTVPNTKRAFFVMNGTSAIATVRSGTFSAVVAIPAGQGRLLFCDGNNKIIAIGGGGVESDFVRCFIAGSGVDESKEIICIFTRSVDFPTNMTNSKGHAETAPSSSTSLTIKKNGASIGTLTFATSTATCTFSTTATSFVAGDRMHIACPASLNSLAGIALALVGTVVQ